MLNHPVYKQLHERIKKVGHCICIGLDPDPSKLTDTDIESFLLKIIEESSDHCIAYKPNISFFEALGLEGLHILERICKRIPSDIPIIMDAKRGDIGNTAAKQASYIFDIFNASAITVNPYMGYDNAEAFLNYKDKLTFILALTSNPGSNDFEKQELANGKKLYEQVITTADTWGDNIGYVVGATQDELKHVRSITKAPFLIPGVGTQGGNYNDACLGKDQNGVAIINVSRAVLYSDKPVKETLQLLTESL